MTLDTAMLGKKVKERFWFMGAEQGQRYETEWMDTRICTVVKLSGATVLLEQVDGERHWAKMDNVEVVQP
jgi:hypothetical protein